MQTKTIKISDLHLNTGQIKDVPKNPRFIKDERYEALKKSIEDDPEMLQLREIVAYDNNGELVVILGNMRYRAMKGLATKMLLLKYCQRARAQRNCGHTSKKTILLSVRIVGICLLMIGIWKNCWILALNVNS